MLWQCKQRPTDIASVATVTSHRTPSKFHHHHQSASVQTRVAATSALTASSINGRSHSYGHKTTRSNSNAPVTATPAAGQKSLAPSPPIYTVEEKCARNIPLNTEDFHLIRTLGTGTFARVCLVRPAVENETNRGRVYALKILRKTEVIRLKQVDHVRYERTILSAVAGHPFITRLHASFADSDRLFLLLDYIPGGELFTYLRRLKFFDEPMARFYAAEIVLVLEYLHETHDGIAYRDLKPENILLDCDGHIKLVDFGFAKRLGNGHSNSNGDTLAAAAAGDSKKNLAVSETPVSSGGKNRENNGSEKPASSPSPGLYASETYTLCGTPEYLAPEVLQNRGHTGAVDWWALGILIFEFLVGYPPFWHQNPIEIYRQILETKIQFPTSPALSSSAQDLILRLCTTDRSQRLGNMAGGAAQVKQHPFFSGIDWDAIAQRRCTPPILPLVRHAADAQCFDVYPEDDGSTRGEYTHDLAEVYDEQFVDF
ncbi:cAMP-dependent protein kinase catalytic subunit PRKX [Ceratocystis lukuohia]|uniref:cAMP-dependent protein kinase n=1 Tax=Ceratocystis lukuohia TaxID=2019550 RepID=A0ABR4M9L4_9PEZI